MRTVLDAYEAVQKQNGARDRRCEVLRNRLFIAEEVRERRLFDSWNEAVRTLEETKDVTAFADKFGRNVSFQIEEAAREDIEKV